MWRLNDTLNFVLLHLSERKYIVNDKNILEGSAKDKKEDYTGIIEYAMAAIRPLAIDKAVEIYSYLFVNEVGLHENRLDQAIHYM